MKQDYEKFQQLGAEVIAMGVEGPRAFKRFWNMNQMPFIGLSDIKSGVASQYYQEVNLLKLGRMPAVFLIDREQIIRYVHYGHSMSDIPQNVELLTFLKQMDQIVNEKEV